MQNDFSSADVISMKVMKSKILYVSLLLLILTFIIIVIPLKYKIGNFDYKMIIFKHKKYFKFDY